MQLRHWGRILLVVLMLAGGRVRAEEALLRIAWGDQTVALTAAEWAKLPRTEVTAADPHTKAEHRYGGVAVHDLLKLVAAPAGEKMHGAAQRLAVLAKARDGYAVLYALAEFDPAFSTRTMVLADRIDGQPLPEKAAPLQVIAPGDQRGARWARMVTALEIVSVGTAPATGH